MGKYRKKGHFEGLIKINNQDVFLAEFKKLTPQEQENFIKYLHDELEAIVRNINDLKLSMRYNNESLLSYNTKLLISIAGVLVFGATTGIGTYYLTNSMELGKLAAITSSLLGLVGNEVLNDHIERVSIRRFFNSIKNRRTNKAINKLKDRKLKLAKKLEIVKTLLTANPKREVVEQTVTQNATTKKKTNTKNKSKVTKENPNERTA